MSQTIFVVDDDAMLRNRLGKYLESQGFAVRALSGGVELRSALTTGIPDLVIMDLMMPGEDGLSLTRHLREISDTGILILTGQGETVDKVVGLEMGADDYLAKPFDLRELLARIRSILRRRPAAAPSPTQPGDPSRMTFAGWVIDCSRREVAGPDGKTIDLTSAEFQLLQVLAENAGRALDRDRLLDAVADRDWSPYDRSIDLHISHLRKKLGDDPRRPQLIKTVRGVGYLFAVESGDS